MHWYCAIVTAICATIGITSLAITVRHVFESSFAEEAAILQVQYKQNEQQQMKQIDMPTLPYNIQHKYMTNPCHKLDLCMGDFDTDCTNCCKYSGKIKGHCVIEKYARICKCDTDGAVMAPITRN